MPETNHHLGLRGGLGTSPTSLVTCSPQVATQATDSPPSSAVSQRWAASCRSHPCCCAPALGKIFGKKRRGGRDTRGASMAPASCTAQVPCGKQQQQVSSPTSSNQLDQTRFQAHPGPAVATVCAQVAQDLKHGSTVWLRLGRGLRIGPALVAHSVAGVAGACVLANRLDGCR